MKDEKDKLGFDEYHRPKLCEVCGGVMVFQGVGEYACEDCGTLAYDDYGKARLYIETHKGATASQIEAATGVKQRTIRLMLKEGRLEVAPDSKVFLYCEGCGKPIRSGRYCPECETGHHRRFEEQQRAERKSDLHGYGKGREEATGEKRFKWE